MKKLILILLLVLVLPMAAESAISKIIAAQSDATIQPAVPHTLLVSVDGTNPPHVDFIDLPTFTYLGRATGIPAGSPAYDIVLYGNFAYYCTSTIPVKIVKVNVTTMAYDSTLTLATNENYCNEMIVDDNGFLYVGINSPATQNWKIVKVNLSTFTEVGPLGFSQIGGGNGHSLAINGDFLYVAMEINSNNIAEVNLNSFTLSNLITVFDGSARPEAIDTISASARLYYLPQGGARNKVCRGTINPLSYSADCITTTVSSLFRITTDSNTIYAFKSAGGSGTITRINTSTWTETLPALVTSFTPIANLRRVIANQSNGNFLYTAGRDNGPPITEYIIKIDRDTWTETATLALPSPANTTRGLAVK